MNIYLIHESGSEPFCIQAETMAKAIEIIECDYMISEESEDPKSALQHYHSQILESCSFIGKLRNVSSEEGSN